MSTRGLTLHDDLTPEAVAMIARIVDFDTKYPGALQREFLDFLDVVEVGAKKYALNNWLLPDGKRCSNKDMHDSMFHHLAESFIGYHVMAHPSGIHVALRPYDKDSGLAAELQLACRSMMIHTRRSRKIIHPDDVK